MSDENRVIVFFILVTVVVVIVSVLSDDYRKKDYATGKTVLDSGVVVDKEHEHKINDGNHSHSYYLIIKQDNNENRVESSESIYRKCRLGTQIVIGRRIGGVSKAVIDTSIRIFEGAEAN